MAGKKLLPNGEWSAQHRVIEGDAFRVKSGEFPSPDDARVAPHPPGSVGAVIARALEVARWTVHVFSASLAPASAESLAAADRRSELRR